jgi:hypothetical protein
MTALSFDQSVEMAKERLRPLFRNAMVAGRTVPKIAEQSLGLCVVSITRRRNVENHLYTDPRCV